MQVNALMEYVGMAIELAARTNDTIIMDDVEAMSDELIKLFVLWATLIAAISASRQNKHLKIDLISKMINTKHALLLETFTGLVTCTICWVIAWNAFRYVGLTFDFDEKVLIDTSAWVVYSIVPVAFSLMGYRYLTISMHNLLKFLRAS